MVTMDPGSRVMDYTYHPTGSDSTARLEFEAALNKRDLVRALGVVDDGATRGIFQAFDVQLKFGLVALQRSQFDEALRDFGRASALASTPKQAAMALNNEGLTYHNIGDSRAFGKLEASVSLWCTFQGAHLNLVLELERLGQARAADLVVATWPRLFDLSRPTVIRNGLLRMPRLRRVRTNSPIGDLLRESMSS
jgi:hypothetical protein